MAELAIWSRERKEWAITPPDEIVWIDRKLLSDGRDQSLHRAPRCPGLRRVHHRWELFSRDPSHQVFVAPLEDGEIPASAVIERTARHILPAARATLETQPFRLEPGAWAIGIGAWVLAVRVEGDDREADRPPTIPVDVGLAATRDVDLAPGGPGQAVPDAGAVLRAAQYFEHNALARLAMAYYYRDFIQGGLAPLAVPIAEVAVALNLSSEASVSEYKKELQRRIWQEQGHQRELGEFLLLNGLLTLTDLREALAIAAANEASGVAQEARHRLRYAHRRRAGAD